MTQLELKRIGKRYADGQEVIRDFSLDIKKGEFVVLSGAVWVQRRDSKTAMLLFHIRRRCCVYAQYGRTGRGLSAFYQEVRS